MRKRKKGLITTTILVIALLIGLSVMLYPAFSDWWNQRVTSRAVVSYDKAVSEMDHSAIDRLFAKADDFNRELAKMSAPFSRADEFTNYDGILNVSGTGIIGYITIPVINVELPIYHGTSDGVLNIAVGHLIGSSFPVGGESTHAVLSAHTGLPSARLFTDVESLVTGDTFTVTVLDRVLTYRVDEINVVLPKEMEKLAIAPGEDYVTLLTCTPYGINSHRLLVRAKRIETVYEKTVLVSADALKIDSYIVIGVIAAPLLLILIILLGKRNPVSLPIEDPLSILPKRNGD